MSFCAFVVLKCSCVQPTPLLQSCVTVACCLLTTCIPPAARLLMAPSFMLLPQGEGEGFWDPLPPHPLPLAGANTLRKKMRSLVGGDSNKRLASPCEGNRMYVNFLYNKKTISFLNMKPCILISEIFSLTLLLAVHSLALLLFRELDCNCQ